MKGRFYAISPSQGPTFALLVRRGTRRGDDVTEPLAKSRGRRPLSERQRPPPPGT